MKKTTLALPSESPFTDAFASEARASGREISVAAGETAPDAPGTSDDGRLSWNPASFASARAVIIQAESALGGRLDELVIFADPPADARPLSESTPREIEASALRWAAGHAHLIREAMRRFSERGGSSVMLALVDRPDRGPLGSMAAGALEGLAAGLLSRQDPACRFMFVRDESCQPELLARFALKTLDDPPRAAAKALRHGGKAFSFNR